MGCCVEEYHSLKVGRETSLLGAASIQQPRVLWRVGHESGMVYGELLQYRLEILTFKRPPRDVSSLPLNAVLGPLGKHFMNIARFIFSSDA